MISMYAEYSGRTLYVALSSDNIEGAKNGDTLYEMDTGKRYVYNESNDAWDEQPEEGGGGGGGVAIAAIPHEIILRNSSGAGGPSVSYNRYEGGYVIPAVWWGPANGAVKSLPLNCATINGVFYCTMTKQNYKFYVDGEQVDFVEEITVPLASGGNAWVYAFSFPPNFDFSKEIELQL